MIEDYPSNSLFAKTSNQPPPKKEAPAQQKTGASPKVEKVISGKAIKRKKPMSSRAVKFFSLDLKDIVQNIFEEVFIPSAKEMVSEAIDQAKNRVIFGAVRSAARRRPNGSSVFGGGNSRMRYDQMSSQRNSERPPPPHRPSRQSTVFEEIIVPTRMEAENVMEELWNFVNEYQAVSVRALYEMAELPFHDVDEEYGWTASTLEGGRVRPIIGKGWLVDLPNPIKLD